jgi:hypothetical protein
MKLKMFGPYLFMVVLTSSAAHMQANDQGCPLTPGRAILISAAWPATIPYFAFGRDGICQTGGEGK